MSIKDYFQNNNINISAFARKYNVDKNTLWKIINGKLTGKRNTNGNTRKIFELFFQLEIIKELPEALKDIKAS
ncbi:putative Mu phage-associated protein [Campylobacter pinnipediorum subsp. caledonicus]|uniref:Putative Mu phage-associated protein n=1 Tax=Campylobacter pinnipediorum subsp. caledonicus TaxID=1874362 RepID=A0A1S6U859_9BACT|nr:hypothetical protein [Campylobacter pinnipediorum]AQW85455.1 putative Mu phage-associated protein [Campylobacter pinnipediorum subsp. caledonicus]AQW87870.1 putative Mu phage-associated protein [Campylobacter pinnipediorum subsp. caledonicus]